MKKVLTGLLVLCMAASLAGCGEKNDRARDIARDTGDALGDIGRGIGDAGRDRRYGGGRK